MRTETNLVRVPVSVVRLGMFAPGSFGVAGSPSRQRIEIWTVRCAKNCGDMALPEFCFASEPQAKKRAEEILVEQAEAEKKHQKKLKQDEVDSRYREQLARGWDGYCFVGVESGQKKLAEMA